MEEEDRLLLDEEGILQTHHVARCKIFIISFTPNTKTQNQNDAKEMPMLTNNMGFFTNAVQVAVRYVLWNLL